MFILLFVITGRRWRKAPDEGLGGFARCTITKPLTPTLSP
jgi:hypothetical protein